MKKETKLTKNLISGLTETIEFVCTAKKNYKDKCFLKHQRDANTIVALFM